MVEKKEILQKLVERKRQLMQMNDVEFLKWAKDKFWINTGYVQDYIESEEFRWQIVDNSLKIDKDKVEFVKTYSPEAKSESYGSKIYYFGKKIGKSVEIFGGMVLIEIGLKILIEHLYFQ